MVAYCRRWGHLDSLQIFIPKITNQIIRQKKWLHFWRNVKVDMKCGKSLDVIFRPVCIHCLTNEQAIDHVLSLPEATERKQWG